VHEAKAARARAHAQKKIDRHEAKDHQAATDDHKAATDDRKAQVQRHHSDDDGQQATLEKPRSYRKTGRRLRRGRRTR